MRFMYQYGAGGGDSTGVDWPVLLQVFHIYIYICIRESMCAESKKDIYGILK